MLSVTQKSDTGITTTNLNVLTSSGPLSPGSITTPDRESLTESYDQLRSVLLNISEQLALIQQRRSLLDLDISTSIGDTKAQLAALYNSIGYTAGIEALEGESVI